MMNGFVKKFQLLIIMVIVCSVNASSGYAIDDKHQLSQQLNQVLQINPKIEGGIAGISVRSAKTGEIVYEHFGNKRLKPASNMKLLTAAAALSTLGESHRFSTEILTDGPIKGKRIHGNLYLKGKGDPTLRKADLDQLAHELKKQGIKVIEGDLVGDDSWYDDIRYSKDMIWSDESEYYGAQVSALSAAPDKDYDTGTIIIEISPAKKVGHDAIINLTPETDYVQIENDVKTVSQDTPGKLTIKREHGSNYIKISGTISEDRSSVKKWVALWEPTGYALDLFSQSIQEQGITVRGAIRSGTSPLQASTLTAHKSMPLSELLLPFMKMSNNGIGEVLVKEMGKQATGEGSWEQGLEVLNSELVNMGVDVETLVIRDGSGISHVTLIPPNQITHLLFAAQAKSWFPSFLDSLPTSEGSEKLTGGTLRYRSILGKVRAKTGTLSTASSLSGYVDTKSGETLLFSIILNNLVSEKDGKRVEEQIVDVLINS